MDDFDRVVIWAINIGVISAFFAFIPAAIASRKGRSFGGFWFYGFLIFPIALIHALVMRAEPKVIARLAVADGSHRKCPFCAEAIKLEDKVCHSCGRDLLTGEAESTIAPPPTRN